jgi:DNA invertase Pin-like site-specific DNA recombinase
MAEYERKRISENTKAALKAAKARGVKLGNPRLDEVRCTDITAAQTARIAKAKARNGEILDVINEIQSDAGELSLRAISRRLNEAGYRTSRGKDWQATSVKRILAA